MLGQRVAVAAVGLPLLALLVAAPERVFGIGVALLLGLATYELVRAAIPDTTTTSAVSAGALAALLATAFRTLEEIPVWSLPATAVVTILLLGLLLWPGPGQAPASAWWLGAILYLGVLGAHWLLLRNEDFDACLLPSCETGGRSDGQLWVIVALATTFATDTGAYVAGRLFGRHKLWPAISPNKTWEGGIGGLLLGAAVGAGLMAGLDSGNVPGEFESIGAAAGWAWVAVIALSLPLAAIAGDFLESALKRRLEVKDMSGLLPGHGGLLDRLDSLLLTGPLLYWFLQGVHR